MTKEKKSVPALRFPEFDGEWELHELGEFIDDRKDVASPDLPLYSLTIESGIVPKSKRYERSFLVKSEGGAYKRMKPKDFAYNPMNLRWGALACHHGGVDIAVSKYYDVFSVNEKSVPEYLEPFLTSYRMVQFYDRMSTGTLEEKKRVHYLDFIHFKKPFPTLPEQRKIADFLTVVDGRIGQLIQKNALLGDYKKGVMQQLFTQAIRFKDDNGNEFPDWEEEEFDLIAERSKEKFDPRKAEIIYPCVELESLTQNTGQLLETFSSSDQKSIKSKFQEGDVLFGKLRPYLRKYLHARFEGVCSSEIWVLSGKKLTNGFLFYLIQTHKFMQAANVSSGSKMPRSDWSFLGSIPFKYPNSRDEQTKIVDFLSAIDRKIESVTTQIAQTQTFKKGLLQQMFV